MNTYWYRNWKVDFTKRFRKWVELSTIVIRCNSKTFVRSSLRLSYWIFYWPDRGETTAVCFSLRFSEFHLIVNWIINRKAECSSRHWFFNYITMNRATMFAISNKRKKHFYFVYTSKCILFTHRISYWVINFKLK